MINTTELDEKISILNKGKRAILALLWIDEAQHLRTINGTQELVRVSVHHGSATPDGKAANYYLGACLDIRLDSILEEMRSLAQLDIDNAEKVLK